MKRTNEHQMEQALVAAIASEADSAFAETLEMSEGEAYSISVRSFEESGILTHNRGLVVRLPNGEEYQLTIVQSSRARSNAEQGDEETECLNCGEEYDESYMKRYPGKCRECGHMKGDFGATGGHA